MLFRSESPLASRTRAGPPLRLPIDIPRPESAALVAPPESRDGNRIDTVAARVLCWGGGKGAASPVVAPDCGAGAGGPVGLIRFAVVSAVVLSAGPSVQTPAEWGQLGGTGGSSTTRAMERTFGPAEPCLRRRFHQLLPAAVQERSLS